MGKEKEDIYPEELTCDEIYDGFEDLKIFDSNGTFNDDYKAAEEYAKVNGGCVYTMVDGDDNETVYLKGLHFVNRFGIAWIRK